MVASVSMLMASIDSALVMGSKRRGCPDAQRRKQIGDLERAADAGAGDLLRRMSGDRPAHQRNLAFVRREHARQQIERRGLAGAIGADQRVQGAVGD